MKKLFLVVSIFIVGVGLTACTVEKDELNCAEGQIIEDDACINDPALDVVSQGVTDTVVKVGNSAATSGALAFVGTPYNAGIQAYFDMVNDAGGVAGRTIDFVTYDDEFNPANGVTYAEKLLMDDQVFAFVGHFGTPTVGATLEYLIEAGIPQVYYATGISALFNEEATGNERASFPVQPIYDAEGQVMVARATAEFSATKIGVIYTNDDAGKGILNGVEIEAANQSITLVIEQVAATATDMSAAALSLFSQGVDVVIVAANQIPAEIAVKALNAAGNTSPVIVSYVNASPTFIANVSDVLANFDIYSSAWINIFNDDASLTDEYTLFVTEVSKIDAAYAANPYAMAGWIAAAFFVEGLERVGTETLNWTNFINAMEEAPVVNPLGGSVDFADGRRAGTQSMSLLKATIIPGTDGADDSYLFSSFKPMETIDEILGNE